MQVPGEVVEFMDGLAPGAVGRPVWDAVEARRDLEMLWWVGRFRFVTAEQLARRLSCSVQRARARVRRLERLGLLGRELVHRSQPRAVFLTGAGHELLGLPRRRTPQATLQREHEAAIVNLVVELERRASLAAMVLTERECRQREAAGDPADRFSVDQGVRSGRRDERRWPDLALIIAKGRIAVEIELTPKSTSRLRAILGGYHRSDYARLVVATSGSALMSRIAEVANAADQTPLQQMIGMRSCEFVVVPWEAAGSPASALAELLFNEHACRSARPAAM